ncbi:MAG: hypothetical protein IPP47_18900 [Bryobacterales bacterium]|nr:hypothetical protein [Bryobacterales bacterium]
MSTESRAASQSASLNRIAPESSWLCRRVAAVLVGIWFGGILLVALAAPASLQSVDSVLTSPPQSITKAVKSLGPELTREILQFQAGEANRVMFLIWGWTQLALAGAVVILLLFLSNVGRTVLGLSFAMMLLAALIKFLVISRIAASGRLTQASVQIAPAELAERLRFMYYTFAAFELVVVVLGSVLLVLLLGGRRSGSGRRHVEEI